VSDQVPHPYKIRGKIKTPYKLIFKFLESKMYTLCTWNLFFFEGMLSYLTHGSFFSFESYDVKRKNVISYLETKISYLFLDLINVWNLIIIKSKYLWNIFFAVTNSMHVVYKRDVTSHQGLTMHLQRRPITY
jgi:hypothetical protein